jgi:FkbM family methyltransferase
MIKLNGLLAEYIGSVLRWLGSKILTLGLRILPKKYHWNHKNYEKWFTSDGDNTLLVDYPLSENSLVIDGGGYTGRYAMDVFCRFNCNLIVFEPVPQFYNQLLKQFIFNRKVRIEPLGLTADGRELKMGILSESSSAFRTSTDYLHLKSVILSEYLNDSKISWVDLLNLNIEGAEFEVLEELIASGLQMRIGTIQVQFHKVVPDADSRLSRIREKLMITHVCSWCFPYVWESWRLK